MSLGDHLDELRKRIIYAFYGLFVAGIFCSIYGQQVISIFCRPLVHVLVTEQISPQLYFTSAGDPFSIYLQMTMISAAVIASPWIIWQLWLFVAAGLYPKERKAVWRYAPLSVTLMLAGVAMCYFVVLPIALRFFITFGAEIPLHLPQSTAPPSTMPAFHVPAMAGDPASPTPYEMWFDSVQQRLKFALPDAQNRTQVMVLPFGPRNLVSPMITLPEYVHMVLRWLAVFAVAFQLPLVTLAAVGIGFVQIEMLRRMRKYVYTLLMIVSALLIPELLTGMLALMLPLWALYEFGILLAWRAQRRKQRLAAAEESKG